MTNIALIVPCLNEARALPALFEDIERYLPGVAVHVFDNNSTDGTPEVARRFGATVHSVAVRGKGSVVARMFSDVDADVYVMVDGDATYDLSMVRAHIDRLLAERIDILVGARLQSYEDSGSRPGHKFGNRLLSGLLNGIFKCSLQDVLSGYRIMSRRFVKSAPVLAKGFEVEVMLTIHALDIRCSMEEQPIRYLKRAQGTASKLNTLRDGLRILWAIIYLFKEVRPFRFFSQLSTVLAAMSLLLGVPVVMEFLDTGLVQRFPTAILAASLMLAAVISFSSGLVLNSVAAQRREMKRLFFLRQ